MGWNAFLDDSFLRGRQIEFDSFLPAQWGYRRGSGFWKQTALGSTQGSATHKMGDFKQVI